MKITKIKTTKTLIPKESKNLKENKILDKIKTKRN